MIELQNDQLHFSFPSIGDELRRLTEGYLDQALPRIVGEGCERAFEELLNSHPQFQRIPQASKDLVRRRVNGPFSSAVMEVPHKEVREKAFARLKWAGSMRIGFQRTFRIPDNGRDYNLPPGLGNFPVRHLDDFAERVPASWLERGGVMMPMYQSEALWLNFRSSYPFALKVASGKINALTGESWRSGLNRTPQDYLVLPEQPWLDGFAVEKGIIRQFVAMPLGKGYSVEEQLSGKAEFGGIQFQAVPMKARVYFERMVLPSLPKTLGDLLEAVSIRDHLLMESCPLPCMMTTR